MKEFERDHVKTKHWLFFSIGIILILLLYLSLTKFYLFFKVITIPFVVLGFFFTVKSFRKEDFIVKKITFNSEKKEVLIEYINGMNKIIEDQDLMFSVLFKRYYKPIRKIQIKIKNKKRPEKTIEVGRMNFSSWKELQNLGDYLLTHKTIKREKWNFDWSTGEVLFALPLMIFAPDFFFQMQGLKEQKVENSQEAEKKYFNKKG